MMLYDSARCFIVGKGFPYVSQIKLSDGGIHQVNKSELVSKVAEKSGLTKKDAEKAINGFIEVVQESLAQDEPVAILGFGTFSVRERAAREGRNPRTGEPIQIPAGKVPVFKPGKGLKDAVSGKIE